MMTSPTPPLSPRLAVLTDTTNTVTTSTTLSHAMATPVVDEAITDELIHLTEENGEFSKWICGTKRASSCIAMAGDHEARLKEILNKKTSNEVDVMHEVTECINDAIDALVQQGLHAYVNLNQNLLRAVETSKSDARDASRHAQLEARLRSDLSSLRGERDEALGIAASLRRKVTLLDGDLQTAKQKVARVEQEKIKMERDNRAAMSLAKSVGTETSSDVEFYKRKVRFLHFLFSKIFHITLIPEI